MSTWHQRQAKTPLWHKTLWSVVHDPPERMTTITLCNSRASAETEMARQKSLGFDHLYVINPHDPDKPEEAK